MTREQIAEAMRCRFTWEAGVGRVRCERAEGHEGRHESGSSWVAAEVSESWRIKPDHRKNPHERPVNGPRTPDKPPQR